jgi:signal transduction histidine kinase
VEEFHRRDGLPSETIRFVHRDTQGVVWLGTPSGVARLDDRRITTFGLKQGLPDENILQLLDDGAGNLWLGTHRGVLRVGKSELPARANGLGTLVFQLYGHNDGLTANLTADGSSPLATSTPDGCLWFCTEEGLARVDPRVTRQAIQAGSLKIDAVQIGEKVVPFRARLLPGRAMLDGNADGREIKIAPGTQEAGIVYSLPTFAAPEDALFQTWLEGYDSGWAAPSARRVAVYSRLPAGTYRFHLRGSAGGGIWTELPEPLTLVVGAFFYETNWFKGLMASLALASTGFLVGVVVRQRARKKHLRLQREKAHELAIETERSRIARDIHDDLGATLTQIAMLSEAAQAETATGQAPASKLTNIFDRARRATRQLDEIIWAIDPGNDTLEQLVSYLCQFASDYLTLAGLKFRFDSPELLPVRSLSSAQRHHLFLAARETLHNVVKHAGATEVWLRVRFENETLHLTIEDDGTGTGQTPAATGRGTANMASRMNELGGSVLRRGAEISGTVVELILPLPPPTAMK